MRFALRGRVVFFATNNMNKFNEARKVLSQHGIATGMLRVKSVEIQSDSLDEIAKASVKVAFGLCRLPVIVEDAGLFVDALKGFPGPYASYVYRTIGNQGLLRAMEKSKDREAVFRSVVAYLDGRLNSPKLFCGEVRGMITKYEERKSVESGFGFDPIFMPDDSKKTFAEMDIEEKNRYSHRAKAIMSFAKWYGKLRS